MKNFMLPFLLFPFFAIGGCTDNVSKTGTKTEAHEQLVQTYTVERYKLFPTQNMWTFIKLDTQTRSNVAIAIQSLQKGEYGQCFVLLKYYDKIDTVRSAAMNDL